MFEFMLDAGNYEDRMVDRSEYEWGFISTARCSDGSHPYETAVSSSEYAKVSDPDETDGMTIVEAYDSPEAAQEGHDRWVKTMTKHPPEGLTDCCNAGIAEFGTALGMEFAEVRVHERLTP